MIVGGKRLRLSVIFLASVVVSCTPSLMKDVLPGVYRGYSEPALPETSLAKVELGSAEWAEVFGPELEQKVAIGVRDGNRTEYGAITLLPGRYRITWGRDFWMSFLVNTSMHAEHEYSAQLTLEGGRIYRLHMKRTHGMGYSVYPWIEDAVTGEVLYTYTVGDNPYSVIKSVRTQVDSYNGITDPKAIRGAVEGYLVELTNTGSGILDTVLISEPIPAYMALRVVDYDGANPGPIAFVDGSPASGLSYTFTSLGSSADDVWFSNDDGGTWTYTPLDSGDGTDPAVTDIRINPKGFFWGSTDNGDPSFQLLFKAVIQ